MENNKISIYVACHKPFAIPFVNSTLKYIEVGAVLHTNHFLELLDSIGDNISNKNLSYNELTALYWAWKNDNESEIKGLCHYRRYFVNEKMLLTPRDIIELLRTNDYIGYKCGPFSINCRERIGTSQSALRKKDVSVVRQIILGLYGEVYSTAFDKILNRKENFLCNMFIAKAEVFDAYCQFLFSVLEKLEQRINYYELIGQQKRIFGLWGEYLFDVFVEANGLKGHSCDVAQVELK